MITDVHFKQIESKIIEHLNEAQNSIEIAVAWITSPAIIDSIDKCLKRKVSVRLLSVNDHINSIDTFTILYYSGAKIRLLSKKLMHNKFCIIDREIVISGSYNWTMKAASNHENITVVFNNFELIDTFVKEFEDIWKRGEEISTLIPINKGDISELNYDFNFYLSNIRRNHPLPYIYHIHDTSVQNKQNSKDNFFGNISKGFYLIKDEIEEHDFFKYLFYSNSSFDFSKLRKIENIPIELKATKLVYVLNHDLLEKESFIDISKSIWVEYFCNIGQIREKFLGRINSNGEFLNEKFRVKNSFGNSYIIYNNDKFQIFQPNGSFLDFNYLNFQIPTFEIYCWGFIDENYFLCDVLINNENKVSKKAIFNINGKMVSEPIFYKSRFTRENDLITLEETPVLFLANWGVLSTVLINNYKIISNTAIQKWNFNKNGKLMKAGEAEFTHTQLKDTHKALYFSDLDYGPLYINISIIKSTWKNKYFELARKQYKSMNTLNVNSFFEKMEIARKIVLEVEKREQGDLENLIKFNKQFEKNSSSNSDFCFVATAIYGDLNHPKTVDFRVFREMYLKNTIVGRKFIISYYLIAPSYVRLMKRSKLLTMMTRKILFIIHSVIIKT